MKAENLRHNFSDTFRLIFIQLVPYIGLLIWTLPLLLLNSEQQSLMAFDEVHYAGRARLMVESRNWINPWLEPHHKTPGYYWLVAAAFNVFGMTENAARLPNLFAGLLATLMVYEIGKLLFNSKIGFLSAIVLNTQFIWMQYSRLSAPDIPMVFLVLLGIVSLLKAESSSKSNTWCFLAGISFGLGFLIRSYVSFLPLVALLPYLVLENPRHKHLTSPALYLGFGVGLSPTFLWLILEWTQYQVSSFHDLFKFAASISGKNRHDGGWYYYLWNIFLNSFPWSVFAMIGMVLIWKKLIFQDQINQDQVKHRLLCLGYPLLLLLEISFVGTRTPRYSLAMYPFLAIHAGVALDWLSHVYIRKEQAKKNKFGKLTVQGLSYFLAGLGGMLVIISLMRTQIIARFPEAEDYLSDRLTLTAFLLGFTWISTVFIFHGRRDWKGAQYWLATLLIGPWLTLSLLSSTGLLSNYNADLKSFIEQERVSNILQNHQVNFISVEKEYANKRLLHFYTPLVGQYYDDFRQVEQRSYVWAKANPDNSQLLAQCRSIGNVRGWKLLYVENDCNKQMDTID